MNPFKFIRFTSFLDYACKALYLIFYKDPINNGIPYKWQQLHFQITFKKTCCTDTLQVAHKTYISGPFYQKANFPKNLNYYLYTYAIILGVLIIFFIFFIL